MLPLVVELIGFAIHPRQSSLPSTRPGTLGWISLPRVKNTEKYGSNSVGLFPIMRFSKKVLAGYLERMEEHKPEFSCHRLVTSKFGKMAEVETVAHP